MLLELDRHGVGKLVQLGEVEATHGHSHDQDMLYSGSDRKLGF